MVQNPITWPLPDEPYCEFCRLQDIRDLEVLTDNMSFLDGDDTKVKEKTTKNILDDSSSSDDPETGPEDYLSESSWILNQYGTNEKY